MNSISFEERTGPALEFPQINCDRPLARRFEGKPILENMNHTFAAAFIGVPGSGKTSLVEAFFKTEEYFYGVFHRIFQIIPPSSAKSVDDSVFQLIPENQKFPKLTLDVLDQVWQTALSMRNRDPPLWTCLIMDDVQSQFKKPEIEQKMKEMLANRRHAGLSIILLAQNYKQIPKDVRKLFTDLFIFDISMAEWDEVYEEHAKFYKKQWQEVLRNYSRRIREEREKERAKKPHEKLFLYLNFKYRELYFGMNMKVNVDENWAPEISATTIRKRKRKDEEDDVTAKAAKTV